MCILYALTLKYQHVILPCVSEIYKGQEGTGNIGICTITEREIVDRKQKILIVKYLGSVKSQEDRERYRKIFEEYIEAMKKFSLNDLTIKLTLSFGLFYASGL